MKAAWIEFRFLIAEWLLGIVFRIAPIGKEGNELHISILNYFQAKIDAENAKRDTHRHNH